MDDGLVDLNKKKIDLLNQIEKVEEKKQSMETMIKQPEAQKPPSKQDVTIEKKHNIEKKCLELHIAVNKSGWIIRSVILFSEGLFPNGGSFVVHPS